MPITDFLTYGELVYSLPDRYASIQRSTLVLATVGSTLAKLEGQVTFAGDVVLDVWELVDIDARRILDYSYEVYKAGAQVLWYDPFEHPHACSELIEGAEATIRALHGKVGLMVITNGLKDVQRPRLVRSTIGNYFADIVISEEVGAAKPDGAIFDVAFGRMNEPRKAEVLIVSDSLTSDIREEST
ncbi:MAG: hypothetical protein CVU38_14280 [Chloroflexi bacterium HGW-Chloroflexi-1]|nr:MAG: hypothetical protein CVU38_14280 [Chloroflexi bacterium HGW-Chloroflexi-1]